MDSIIPPDNEVPNLYHEMKRGVQALNRQGIVMYGELSPTKFDVDLTEKGHGLIEDQTAADRPVTKAFTVYLEALNAESNPDKILSRLFSVASDHLEAEGENLLREYQDNASTLPVDPLPAFPEILLMQFEPALNHPHTTKS